MLMLETFHRLLLAAACLCACGTPVRLPSFAPAQDSECDQRCVSAVTPAGSIPNAAVESKPSDESVFRSSGLAPGLAWNVGAEGGADPNVRKIRPKGIRLVPQTEIGDSRDGRSGTSEADGEAWNRRSEVKTEAGVGSASEMEAVQRQSEDASVLPADSLTDEPTSALTGDQVMTQRLTPHEFSGSSTAPSQLETSSEGKEPPDERPKSNQEGEGRTRPPDGEGSDPKASRPPPTEPSVHIQRLTSLSATSPSSFSTALSMWGHESATASTLPESLPPEIGPNLMPREDGPENLWTEAARSSSADTVIPLSPDEATEGTMSSEALPLIFEPFDEITPEGAAAPAVAQAPGSAQPPAAMATRGMPLSEVDLDQLVTVETDSDGPSRAPPMLIPDWTSTWQTSGAELLEPISPSGPSVSQRRAWTDPEGVVRTPSVDADPTTAGTLPSSQQAMTTTVKARHRYVHKSRSGFVEMESDEEPDEDEEDENSEESLEEESEEDLTETPKPSSTQPPYSLIPPPPVWAQRNQGLMRSWVELIKEKAGYVSGMLAPVGIGITGALLIVGALYSIRMIHRKRRNSFKHQRRKVRQPEQPREPGVSRQDQAMLLADSSEDEF